MDLRNHLDRGYGRGIFGFSNISIEKVNNAKEKYANDVDLEDVVLLIDDTVFGSAKCGVLITFDGLYIGEDFEEPMYFAFEEIESICVKRKMLAQSLYINDRKTKGFTQPEYDELKSLFSKLETYIQYYNSENRFLQIKDQANILDIDESVEKIENKNVESQFSTEFSVIRKYDMYNRLMELKKLNDKERLNNSLLFGSSRNPQSKLESIIRTYLISSSILIRDKVLYGKSCEYFLDDSACKESMILSCIFLRFEFERLGLSIRQFFEVLETGLFSVFDNNETVFEIRRYTNLPKVIQVGILYFYIRIYFSNIFQGDQYYSSDDSNDIPSKEMLNARQRYMLCQIDPIASQTLQDQEKTKDILIKMNDLTGQVPILELEHLTTKAVNDICECVNIRRTSYDDHVSF